MTIVNEWGDERILGRRGGRLWDVIQREWAGENPARWKQLACLHLRLHCEWPVERIARAIGHSRGHTLRMLARGLIGLQQECADLQIDLSREFMADAPPTAVLVPATPRELNRRIDHCQIELDLWARLRKDRLRDRRRRRECPAVRLRIVPGSLREQIAEFLDEAGPSRWKKVLRQVSGTKAQVIDTLWACPEFVCDAKGWWSLHRFDGQETIGVDVEEVPATDVEGGVA